MASMWQRFSLIFKAKAHKKLDAMENPGETLDYAYDKQVEKVRELKRSLVDVAAARKRIELQGTALTKDADTLAAQAQRAVDMGREDLAREALTRKASLVEQIQGLAVQRDQIATQEDSLTRAISALETKIVQMRTQKETVKAKYAAAKAQVEVNESVSGLSDDLASIGSAMQRAEDKTAQMQARASATDELLASGVISDFALGGKDSLTRELDALSSASSVEAELAALKGELLAPERPKELG